MQLEGTRDQLRFCTTCAVHFLGEHAHGKIHFWKEREKRRLARDANQTDRHNRREAAALKYVTRRRSDMTGGSLASSQLGLPQTAISLEMHNSVCQSFAVIKIPKLHLIDQRDKQLGIWSKWKQFLCWRRESSAFGNLDTYFILSWLIYGFLCVARILLEYPSSCLSADRATGTIMPPSLKTYMPFSEALFLFHSCRFSTLSQGSPFASGFVEATALLCSKMECFLFPHSMFATTTSQLYLLIVNSSHSFLRS